LDSTTRINLLIGGDATQAKKALADAENSVKKFGDSTKKTAQASGKATGEEFGKGMSQATDRWMRFTSGALRKHFGEWGRYAADALEHVDKFSKAVDKTPGLRFGSVRATGASPILSGATQGAVATGIAAGVGAGAGVGLGKSSLLDQMLARNGNGSASTGIGDFFDMSKSPVLNRGRKILKSKIVQQALQLGLGGLGLLTKGIGAAAIIGTGGAIGGVAGGFAALSAIGKNRDKQRGVEIEGFKTKGIVEEINNIKDPVERTRAILKEFGEDGQAKFREMEKSVAQFNKTLSDTSGWRAFGEAASISTKVVFGAIKDLVSPATNFIKDQFQLVAMYWSGLSKEVVDEIAEGEATIQKMQAKSDKMAADRASLEDALMDEAEKKSLEARKIQEQIQSVKAKELDVTGKLLAAHKELSRIKREERDSDQKTLDLLEKQQEIKALTTQFTKENAPKMTLGALAAMDVNGPQMLLPGQQNAVTSRDILMAKMVGVHEQAASTQFNARNFKGASTSRQWANYLRGVLGARGHLDSEEFEGFGVEGGFAPMLSNFKRQQGRIDSASNRLRAQTRMEYIRTGKSSIGEAIIDLMKNEGVKVLPSMGK
jgi:hypothetical protein